MRDYGEPDRVMPVLAHHPVSPHLLTAPNRAADKDRIQPPKKPAIRTSKGILGTAPNPFLVGRGEEGMRLVQRRPADVYVPPIIVRSQ